MARTAVVAGTASAVAGRVHHRQQEKWNEQAYEQQAADQQAADADAYRQQMQAQQAQQAAASMGAAPAGDDLTAKLQQLAELKQQGILTDEEFAAAKAKLLG